ncbi:MAG: ribose-phosphate pyrophosphokinase [Parvibaculum sedimenti]|uniref:ribose-phosphate diphosphokinase n=1 Tax=Parvibaculum sedimenti TaxID=2608632 RepID=UPI003BB7A3A7
MKLFALNASRDFGEKVAISLGVALDAHEERKFEDGEHKARPLVSVRGEDVYIVQSLHGGPDQSPNDKLCRLLFYIGTMKENGASRVTAVIPYLAYARKDRQTKSRDPVTTRYVAQLLEAVGTDCVVTMEVHNIVAFQNAFRCQTIHLDTCRLFSNVAAKIAGDGPVVVASPDPGGVKRAQLFREALETSLGRPVGSAFMEKRRSAGVVSGNLLVGEVRGANVLIVDDLIASGGTMTRAASACREAGAQATYAFAAHGLFTGSAATTIKHPDLAKLFIADTVPPFRLDAQTLASHVEIISAAPLFAETIRRLHAGGSINDLLEGRS